MRFEALQERGAFGFARAFESDALLVVRRARWRRAKFRAAQPLQPRQNLPTKLINQNSPQGFVGRPLRGDITDFRQGTTSAVPIRRACENP